MGLGAERLSFEDAIQAEPGRLAGEGEKLLTDPKYHSKAHRVFSYSARGDYAVQLDEWYRHFPKEQVLVVLSEDLYSDSSGTHARILEYLGLAPHRLAEYGVFTRRAPWTGPPLSEEAKGVLRERFSEPNRRLADLLGRDPGWG